MILKKLLISVILTSLFSSAICFSQDPSAPIWGIYASGVGERLSTCMDPCWVTYTVALTTDPNVVANLEYGTMGAISTNITWREATALQRRYGRYYDDEPDGIYKCTPCEVPRPDLSCAWSSTYGGIHWGKGYYGNSTKTISGKLFQEGGVWIYRGTWGRTNSSRFGKVEFRFTSANSFTGFWTENGSTRKANWSGSGNCN